MYVYVLIKASLGLYPNSNNNNNKALFLEDEGEETKLELDKHT